MELNFSELDNMTTQNPYEQFNSNDYGVDNNSDKYWEQAKSEKEQQTKKKKVSFNDILSNMNLVVNKKGILQFMQPTQEPQQNYEYEEQYYQQQYAQPQQRQTVTKQQQYAQPQQRQTVTKQQQYAQPQMPVDPSVKHSYIYNKYFKDYQDASPSTPEIKVPKTKQEYLKMLLQERIRQNIERKRISQIKSTKLFFTTNTGNQGNVNASKNALGKMNFR